MDVLAKPKLAVAYSGGADSTALLVETHQKHPEQTIAFHVHHGLQAAADGFVTHCQSLCDALKIPLHVAYVHAGHAAGASPEDAARNARYKALIHLAKRHGVVESGGKVLVAQHADDQVETLILALSRGAGLGGLSAMPAQFERDGVLFERPMLDQKAVAIRAKLQADGIAYVEDPTNLDKALTRNKIRHDVLPALQAAFPAYAVTFARSISHIAQANDLLVQLAEIDLEKVGIPPRLKDVQALAPNRQANSLRYWLQVTYGAIPSAAQLKALLKQIAACQTRGHQIDLKIANGWVIRQGASLLFLSERND